MEMSQKKRHTLVIGGTRGIGRAIVKALSKEGHVLSVIGRRQPEETGEALPNVTHWLLDLLDSEGVSQACREILSQNGKLSNLVFSQRYRGQADDWTGELETTLTATKEIIDNYVEEFDGTGENSIVIVSSIASHLIAGEQPLSFHVAKAGLRQMVRYYAVTLGPKAIRVNSVSPCRILKAENQDFYLNNKQVLDFYTKITPLGRMGTAEDIANVVSFICSPSAAFITGQDLVVDGGMSLSLQDSVARDTESLPDLIDPHVAPRSQR